MAQLYNWSEIYTKNAPKLIGVSRRYVKNSDVAEDLVHDAFETAMLKVETFKGLGAFEGWLYKIVVFISLDYVKNQSVIAYYENEDSRILDEPVAMTTQNVTQMERLLNASFSQEELLQVIDLLPDQHRTVFNMYVIDGFSHQQIADSLNIQIGTSKSHLSRARKKIHELLLELVAKREKGSEKKRRWILFFWLWLGLGDRMLGFSFKQSFSDYTITPQKKEPLFFPHTCAFESPFSLTNWAKKHTFWAFSLLSISGMCFIISLINHKKAIPRTTRIELKTNKSGNIVKEKKLRVNRQPLLVSKVTSPHTRLRKSEMAKLGNSKTLSRTPAQSKPANKTTSNATSDSLILAKPIIIKRQRIKHDTLYVEKTP
ncbi:MAG: hypothetical protein CFE24_01265 [Flavobacterium sp. BFFFF2]|nr:MAG: hypothetical protein CFE24_01265 [Flavobacterium sp. BFFFF2]